MITQTIRELAEMKEKVAALESEVAKELDAALRALPATYGFDSARAFVQAVQATAGKRGGRSASASSQPKNRRPRATITDATRAEVKKLVEEGKTGKEISEGIGISSATVQNIKKALGLVKK